MMGQVGFTKPGVDYPGYINVTREGDTVTISLRGEPRDGQVGPFVTMKLTWAEWRTFYADIADRL